MSPVSKAAPSPSANGDRVGTTPSSAAGAAGAVDASQSLQARITAAILVTAVVVLAIGCSLFMLEQRRAEQIDASRVAHNLTELLGALEGPALFDPARSGPPDERETLAHFSRLQSLTVTDLSGRPRLLYRSVAAPVPGSVAFGAPVTWRGRRVGAVVVSIRPPQMGRTFGRYLAMGGAMFFAAIAMALFIGRWLAGRITTPVARLSTAMDAVGAGGEMAILVPLHAPDEIGRLTERFNALMKRLHLKDQALRSTMADLVDARDAAEAANLAKSQFLANMSHEIRTPLNGVLAMAQVLEQGAAEPCQRDQARIIRQSGETLLCLLNDMLDVSKIEAGRLELEEIDFDFEAMVRAALAGFAAVAERKGVALNLLVGETARGRRRGDPARVRQVLNNFVSNALKFTEHGQVTVSLEGEGEGGADGVRLAVRDTGIGIAPEKLAMVFQRFVQVDASTTRRFGGTGLGLAICEELGALMGGRVWVESEPGRGSTFYASLPLARTGAAADETPAASPASADPPVAAAAVPPVANAEPSTPTAAEAPVLRVLAAEDNPTNQLVLTTVMQIFGFELTLAADGREALELWREGGFDVVLMDIQMPVMDGVAATRAIRSLEAAEGRPHTPILALSANALPEQVAAYLGAGMDGHVAKPIELTRLQAALEQVLLAAEDEAPAAAHG